MSKDHVPSDFSRESGYRSDLEIAETQPAAQRINTSFGSRNHNVYVMKSDGTHEHFFYDPANGKSGWHGSNYETKNNQPKQRAEPERSTAVEKNSFIESLKVDRATLDRLDAVSREAAQNRDAGKAVKADNGGRERSEDSASPGSLGRESGLKTGETSGAHAEGAGHSEGATGQSGIGGQAAGSQGSGGQGGTGGQGSGGQGGTGGQGSGGQGGTSGQGSGGQGGGGQGSGGQGGH